jgi:Na+-driven multidrug efflux pump
MVATAAAVWLANLPLAWTLAMVVGWGAVGAWIGLTSEILVIALLMLWRIQGSRWLEQGMEHVDEAANDPSADEAVAAA